MSVLAGTGCGMVSGMMKKKMQRHRAGNEDEWDAVAGDGEVVGG